uniref:ARAD1C45166p n=1 Tax=Blastobotrys adeninivorans TaxID=409370 RepID=A0A060TAE4_BLAAD
MSSEKEYVDVPNFVLDEVPVLANRARDEITVSRNGLWADPYPHMAKPRRSFSGMTEEEYRKESDPELVKPIPRTPSPQRSASHGALLMTTAPDSVPSANTSVSSYHTPDSTPQGKTGHGTSLVVPDSGHGMNDGSGHSPRLRHRSSSPQLKAAISREGSPLSTTPQHLKYPKSYQSNMELRSQFDLEQQPSAGQRQTVRPSPQMGQPPVMQPQFPQQQAQVHSPYLQQQHQQPQNSSIDPPLLPPRPQRKSHGDNFRSAGAGGSPSLQQQGFIPNTAIVTWNSSDPAEWTMDRVVYWLQAYRFGPDWAETFRSRNICGEKFLSLTSYQNFKKLGIFYNKSEDYDTTPSRFIHLLRKQLNRSASNNSTDGMIAAANSPTATSTSNNNAATNATAITTPTPASGFQTIAPTTTAPASITDSQRYAATDSRHGSDVEGTSPESSRSPSNWQSFENLADSHRMAPPPRRHPLESAQRPSSHFENRISWRAPSPSSPSFRGHGFFRRHQKSSSSESGTLALQSASTTSLGVYPELSEPERRQYGPQDHEAKRSRGIFGKLRKKDPRHGRDEHKLDSPTSPNASMSHPSSFQPCFADTLPLIYRPVHNNASLPFILVTVNNETFTMIPISDIFTASQLREKLSSELSIRDWRYSTVHLTDIGSSYGKALDDSMIEDAIKSVKSQGPNFEILKLYIHTPVPTPMSRSPGALSADSDHPATPNYMIYKNDKKPDDYFSGKHTEEQSKVNLQSQPQPQLQPPPVQQSAQSVPTVTVKEAGTNPPRPSTSRIPTASSEDSFKVIRPQRREINFDDRRSSPYERRKPSIERKPSNPLVAMRAAPPPPASRQASIKSKLRPPTIVTQLSDNTTLAPGGSQPNEAKAPLSGPYSPGESEKLIPKPYVSRKNVVTRKPVGSGIDSASPLEPPSPGAPSPTSAPSIRSVNTITASDSSKLKLATEGLSRESTLKGGQRPEKDDGKFVENEISFEGAPEYVDDDSDDDDGLWAKKPPSLKPERPTLTVKTDNTNNAPSSPLKTPDTTSSCGSPTQREEGNPNWAVRPPAEVVYDNLERFFPNTDLDKPIIDDLTSEYENNAKKPLSPIPHDMKEDDQQQQQQQQQQQASRDPKLNTPAVERKPGPAISRRMKSIRVVAREAREASEAMRRISSTQNRKVNSGALLRRRSTKMWGTKVVEVTSSDARHISTLRDQKGEFKEFAWVKGELIGKGTFGKVYLALNVTTREMMAVKQVEVPQTASDKADAKQKEVIEALHSEVETLKDLDHLNIVQYLGFEATVEYYNLFLEYVPGGSIGRILQMYGRLEESVIMSLTEQVLEGLSYLHTRGILHRDLKADNLLLDLDGICKISDFGISKKSRDIYANDAEMSMQGTIFWMAPEVIHNVVHNEKQGYSAKVDVWSLGCVVLEMFAGRRPWSTDEAIGAMYKLGTTRQRPPIPEDTVPYVSEAGKDFLDQCFIIDPHKRPTPQRLLQHKFCEIPNDYNFENTRVAQLIKSKSKRRRGTLTNRN